MTRTPYAFTLIELLLVMAVLAVIGGITSTFLFGAKTTATLEEESRQIVNTLRVAGQRSVTQEENASWGVHFDNTESMPFYELFWGTSYAVATTSDRVYFANTIIYQGLATSTNVVFAKRTGNPTNGTSTIITIQDSVLQSIKTITVSPIGRVIIQ